MQQNDHVFRRHTTWGRWLPFGLFALNTISWVFTGLLFHQERLIWLVFLPLVPLALYAYRTKDGRP